jgi:flagellar biosynthetic protein FliQ
VDALDSIVREALIVAALVTFPVLGIATAVGVAVAIVQAATQVQEQTLTLLPKLLAVGAALAIFGGAALGACGGLFEHAIAAMPQIVRGSP